MHENPFYRVTLRVREGNAIAMPQPRATMVTQATGLCHFSAEKREKSLSLECNVA